MEYFIGQDPHCPVNTPAVHSVADSNSSFPIVRIDGPGKEGDVFVKNFLTASFFKDWTKLAFLASIGYFEILTVLGLPIGYLPDRQIKDCSTALVVSL